MTRFLSDAWLAAVDAALQATGSGAERGAEAGASCPGGPFVVGQVVTGTPTGEVRYALVLSDGAVHVRPHPATGTGPEADADATFTEDYDTAVALHRGDLSPQQAFMTGRIRVSGNIAGLMANQDALAALEPALAAVRRHTTY